MLRVLVLVAVAATRIGCTFGVVDCTTTSLAGAGALAVTGALAGTGVLAVAGALAGALAGVLAGAAVLAPELLPPPPPHP
ncbi:hypothetical protein [Caballeronia grimmiae]|uniref:hypothetical protein n=1 Tax=Caballeronia grimmiae TaxID=1071679 RepID=UPI0038BDEE00